MYRVSLTKTAAKDYRSVEAALAKRLAKAFEMLEQNPRQHPNIKALKGELAGRYRYRVGDYRVVYRIDDDTTEVRRVGNAHHSSHRSLLLGHVNRAHPTHFQ